MRRPITLTALTLVTLLLAACRPEPPVIVLSAVNATEEGEPDVCTGALRGKLTLHGNTTEVTAAPGDYAETVTVEAAYADAGEAIIIEAWCETDAATGYARVDGVLGELASFQPVTLHPPREWDTCLAPSLSAAPTPCITSTVIKQASVTLGR